MIGSGESYWDNLPQGLRGCSGHREKTRCGETGFDSGCEISEPRMLIGGRMIND